MSGTRTRWVSVGALCATLLGGGGLLTASASVGSGERAVFVPITPCRIMDTRPAPNNVGPRIAPLGPGDTYTIAGRGTNGNCTIPTDAVGLVLNVTTVNGTAGSYLTVYPADAAKPLAANLNWEPGQAATPNAVTVRLSADGRVSFFNYAGSVDVVADVAGYYADHDFDDRYYTKAAVDAMVAGKADKAVGPLVIGPSSFQWDGTSGQSYGLLFGTGRLTAGSVGGTCLSAPLDVPNQATVTSVVLHAYDANVGNDLSFGGYSDPAGATSPSSFGTRNTTGATGEQTITLTPISTLTIDHHTTSYFVWMCLGSNSSMWFEDVVVNYTLP